MRGVSLWWPAAYVQAMTSSLKTRLARVIVLTLAVVGVGATPALAKHGKCVPPGNSGAWQYSENVPTASCGGQPDNNVNPGSHSHGSGGGAGRNSSGGGGSAVPASSVRSLAAQGPAGVAAANFAQATAPSRAAGHSSAGHGPSRRVRGGAGRVLPAGTSPGAGASVSNTPSSMSNPPSAASSIFGTLTGSSSGGLGALLPILLGAAFLALGGFALLRARRIAGIGPHKRPGT